MKLLMIFFVILCSGCASVSQKGRNKASYDGFLVRENGMPVAKAMVALQENRGLPLKWSLLLDFLNPTNWQIRPDEILAVAETDSEGYFSIPLPSDKPSERWYLEAIGKLQKKCIDAYNEQWSSYSVCVENPKSHELNWMVVSDQFMPIDQGDRQYRLLKLKEVSSIDGKKK